MIAAPTSTRPAPWAYDVALSPSWLRTWLRAVVINADWICAGVQLGRACLTRAAAPATWGARHRGARHEAVLVHVVGARPEGGEDVDARGDDVGHQGVHGPVRAPRREARHPVGVDVVHDEVHPADPGGVVGGAISEPLLQGLSVGMADEHAGDGELVSVERVTVEL